LVNNRELDALEALKAEAEEQLEQEARSHPAVARLTTAPGFGTIRAAQVVAAQAVAIGITPRRVYDPEHRGRCPQPA
jgi:transposase